MDISRVQPWWVLAWRGVIAIVFGLLTLLSPGLTLLGLMTLFGAYALVGGVASVVGAIRLRRRDEDWWLPLLLGAVSIGAGVVAVMHPGLTALILILLIGANSLATGVLDIVAAVRLRKLIAGEWLLALNGLASVVFGGLIFLFPGAGAAVLMWLISMYAVATGALLIGVAVRLRSRAAATSPAAERRVMPDRRSALAH